MSDKELFDRAAMAALDAAVTGNSAVLLSKIDEAVDIAERLSEGVRIERDHITNINISLFKGDPTKGHEGWLVEVQFSHPETRKQVRVAYDIVYPGQMEALMDVPFLITAKLREEGGKAGC